MPPRVHRLATALANQIAAGEVVERPASVVKELMENSLDAGARRVDVDIEGGGSRLIRVRDDGSGIHPEDLVLAVTSHATSKIEDIDDLSNVTSLGFRGEALPSIASVSRLTLGSRQPVGDIGWRIGSDGGELPGPARPFPHPPGTVVEVRDLFYNTPARRKFLRSEKTELARIQEVVRKLALARHDLEVQLRHGSRVLVSVKAARDEDGQGARVARLLGKAVMEQAFPVHEEAGGLRLTGWVVAPDAARAQADMQYFYLNGRSVRDKLLSHAVRQGFGDSLYPGRYPGFVLYLWMDPGEVDVNVHPTKHEVRFREARLIHDFVYRGVAGVVASLKPGVSQGAEYGTRPPVRSSAHRRVGARPQAGPRELRESTSTYRALVGVQTDAPTPGEAPKPVQEIGALGLVDGRYLIAVRGEGVVTVDVIRAAVRVAHRALNEARATGAATGRPLLVPMTMEVDEAAAAAVESVAEQLGRLGLDLVRSGPSRITIHRMPSALHGRDPDAVGRHLAAVLSRGIPAGELLLAVVAEAGVESGLDGLDLAAFFRSVEGLSDEEHDGIRAELGPIQLDALLSRGGSAKPAS